MLCIYRYFQTLPWPRAILWCYLIWYLSMVAFHFDPAPRLWLNALGISLVIGTALVLSVSNARTKLDRWQVARLFIMPFCVSSFSALIKGQGFFLIFSPHLQENLTALAWCAGFLAGLKLVHGYPSPASTR